MYPLFRVVENKYSIFSGKSEEEICSMIEVDHSLFLLVPVKSKEICFTAVQQDPSNICYVKNPCESLQLEAVSQIPEIIIDIKNPTDNVKRLAVSKSYHTLQYIDKKVITSATPVYNKTGEQVGISAGSSYELIFEAFKKAKVCDDENYVLALVPDLIKDTHFLKAFKKEINDNVILQHLSDYLLERYESFDSWLRIRDYPSG